MTHQFDATDRCDQDQSERAAVLVEKSTHYGKRLTLALCGHHYEENATELHAWGWEVAMDERPARQLADVG